MERHVAGAHPRYAKHSRMGIRATMRGSRLPTQHDTNLDNVGATGIFSQRRVPKRPPAIWLRLDVTSRRRTHQAAPTETCAAASLPRKRAECLRLREDNIAVEGGPA